MSRIRDTSSKKLYQIFFTVQMQDHLCDVQLQLPGHLLVSARGGAGCLPHQGHQHLATVASRPIFMPHKPKLTVKMEIAVSKY
jgi:hypothetical protein